jgi:hypothetical protein
MVFYKNGAPEISLKRLSTLDSVMMYNNKIKYLATTFNEIKDKRNSIDSPGLQTRNVFIGSVVGCKRTVE